MSAGNPILTAILCGVCVATPGLSMAQTEWPTGITTEELAGLLPPEFRMTPEGFYDAAPEDGKPSPLVRIPGVYPRLGGRMSVQASCMMTFDIDEEGRTGGICGQCALPPSEDRSDELDARLKQAFRDAAVEAVETWRYTLGEPLAGVNTPVVFQLEDKLSDPPELPAAVQCPALIG